MWTSWWWELWSWNLFPRNRSVRNDSRSWRRLAWSNGWSWCWTGGMVGGSTFKGPGARGKCLTLSKNMIASENLQHGAWLVVLQRFGLYKKHPEARSHVSTFGCVMCQDFLQRESQALRVSTQISESIQRLSTRFSGLFSQVVLPKNVNPGPRDVSASDMWNHARSRDQEMRHVFPACLDAQSTVIHWYTKNHCM